MAAIKLKLSAEKRELLGRKVKNLRKQGFIPGNIFGKNIKSIAIKINEDDFKEVFKKAGETQLVEVQIGKEAHPVLITNVQVHPVTDQIIHADLKEVNLKERVTATVPVELIGESPAEKDGLGVLVQLIDEIDVEALPLDIPDVFELDVSSLKEEEQSLSVGDIKYDKDKIEILNDKEQMIARIAAPQKEEEPEPVAEEEAEGEGETPAEPEAESTEETTEGEEETPKNSE